MSYQNLCKYTLKCCYNTNLYNVKIDITLIVVSVWGETGPRRQPQNKTRAMRHETIVRKVILDSSVVIIFILYQTFQCI